jgi:putative ABC transport system permease protein
LPVQLQAGHIRYRTSLTGLSDPSELKVPRDKDLNSIAVPLDGIMLSRPIADILRVSAGEKIFVKILEGKRPVKELTVAKLSDDILGFSATMDLSALNRLLREGPTINAASLKVDPLHGDEVWKKIQEMPKVEASSVKALWIILFDETIAGMIAIGAIILTGFGLLIAVGVVYNSARISFHERAWELAGLRILGFTRGEVATILISELALAVAFAIPLGLMAGRMLIELIVSLRVSESFQIPVVIEPASYAAAAAIVLLAAIGSALLVKRRIDQLDLVSVLKTRE